MVTRADDDTKTAVELAKVATILDVLKDTVQELKHDVKAVPDTLTPLMENIVARGIRDHCLEKHRERKNTFIPIPPAMWKILLYLTIASISAFTGVKLSSETISSAFEDDAPEVDTEKVPTYSKR